MTIDSIGAPLKDFKGALATTQDSMIFFRYKSIRKGVDHVFFQSQIKNTANGATRVNRRHGLEIPMI